MSIVERNSRNSREGRVFEQELLRLLKDRGFYAVKLTNTNGTAFDILAVKTSRALAIEAKHIQYPYFPLSNLTPNEREGLTRYTAKGNKAVLAFKWQQVIYALDFCSIDFNKKSIRVEECELLEAHLRRHDESSSKQHN